MITHIDLADLYNIQVMSNYLIVRFLILMYMHSIIYVICMYCNILYVCILFNYVYAIFTCI